MLKHFLRTGALTFNPKRARLTACCWIRDSGNQILKSPLAPLFERGELDLAADNELVVPVS